MLPSLLICFKFPFGVKLSLNLIILSLLLLILLQSFFLDSSLVAWKNSKVYVVSWKTNEEKQETQLT